jgi:hypothetical protein
MLPVPKIIADMEAGGPLITAMRGTNKYDLERSEAKLKASEAHLNPLKTIAQAASQMTYSKLMQPQYLAKLMGNSDVAANLSQDQREQVLKTLYGAGTGQGTGQGTGNQLLQGFYGEPTQESPFDNFKNILTNWLTGGKPPQNNNQQPMQQPSYMPPQNQAPSQNRGVVNNNQPEQVSGIPGNESLAPPENNIPQSSNKEDIYADKAARLASIKKEGEKSGTNRADDIKELDTAAYNGRDAQVSLNDLGAIVSSPEFKKIRNVPLAGQHELGWYSLNGTPEEKQMIGKFLTLSGDIVAKASKNFAGPFRVGEQKLLFSMKPNASDMPDVAIGKIEALSTMNTLLSERAALTSKMMSQYHINKGQASDMADKQLNGAEIRRQIHDRFNPQVTIKNKKTGEIMTLTPAEARNRGVDV